jgi:protein gp37
MNNTAINWTQYTWNPASGCEVITEGCKYCYAKTLAENRRGTPAFPNGFDLTIRPHKLNEPLKLKRPSLIFVNSMSDLFWEKLPEDYRDQIIDVIEATPQHQYQVLTKRPERMLAYSQRRKLPPNFWAGATIESNRHAGRADLLRQIAVPIRFISAEPILDDLTQLDLAGIQWLITGGESGLHLRDASIRARRGLAEPINGKWQPRSDRYHWITQLVDATRLSGTAMWHKQWGGPTPHSAGRLVDGRTWDEMPTTPLPSTSQTLATVT